MQKNDPHIFKFGAYFFHDNQNFQMARFARKYL